MINIIVKILEDILSLTAVVIVIGCGIVGFASSNPGNFGTLASLPFIDQGVIAEFLAAAFAIGIPMLLIQMNRHLESINSILVEQSIQEFSSPRLPETFYRVPSKAT